LSLIPDLIRHGKNHIHVRQNDFPSSQAHPAPAADARSQPECGQQPDVQVQSQPKQQQATKAQPATAKQSQQLTREVEKIVREEREAMEKLPTYKGLERFTLVEKKGEYVHFNLVHPNRLADLFLSSVEHSPTCTKLSTPHPGRVSLACVLSLLVTFIGSDIVDPFVVKAVRKYELTSSQVSAFSPLASTLHSLCSAS
jgi:hypothetical protein